MAAALWAIACMSHAVGPDPTYDHQVATYNATFAPAAVTPSMVVRCAMRGLSAD